MDMISKPSSISGDLAFTASGDCMTPGINDGDIVYIERGPVEDGQIAAVILDGEKLLKRIYHTPDGGIILSMDNKRYLPIILDAEQAERLVVVGRASAVTKILA